MLWLPIDTLSDKELQPRAKQAGRPARKVLLMT